MKVLTYDSQELGLSSRLSCQIRQLKIRSLQLILTTSMDLVAFYHIGDSRMSKVLVLSGVQRRTSIILFAWQGIGERGSSSSTTQAGRLLYLHLPM
jgi:hypothetical protein